MFIQVVFPFLVHVGGSWLWSRHVERERIVTATAGIQQAVKIKSLVHAQGYCLKELPGWERDQRHTPGALITTVKVTGKRLTFECDQEGKEFWVSISFPRDGFGHLEATFSGPLKVVYWREGRQETKVLHAGADIPAHAKLLAIGE
jgi:hypothetical protein